MHNHLKKLGFFTSNTATNSNEEEKRVKYLYKNEKHCKIKSKSSNEENSSVKRRHHHHHHHHKHRRHHKTSSSQAELDLLLLTTEEGKKHRKKHRKKHEKDEENYGKVHKKKKPEQLNTNTSLDKYFVIEPAANDEFLQRKITKKRSSSAPVRIIEPETKTKDKKRKEPKSSRKNHHVETSESTESSKKDRKSSKRHHRDETKPTEREKHKHYRKSRRKKSPELKDKNSYSQNFPSIPSFEKKTRSTSVQRISGSISKNTKSVSLNVPSTLSKINAYLLQHEKFLAKTGNNISVTSSEPVTENFSTFENCSKQSFNDEELISTSNEQHKSILKPKNCLVQTSFSIVNIPSVKQTRESIEISSIERKKKSRSYRKYYDFNAESTSFSDCHKNYDSGSIILGESPRFCKRHRLGVELIKPEVIIEEKKKVFAAGIMNHSKFSKIPVFSQKKSKEMHEEKKLDKFKTKGRLNRNKSLPPIKEKSSSLSNKARRCVQAENVKKPRNNSQSLSVRVEEKQQLSARSKRSAFSDGPAKKQAISCGDKSPFGSLSDTKLAKQTGEKVAKKQQASNKGNKSKERSLRGSLSNSTFGDKSVDSGRTQTSFLLTKTYKDEDKWKRWQKRKEYADSVRKNLISRTHQNRNNHPLNEQQIVEIRYLTVENCNAGDDTKQNKRKDNEEMKKKKRNEETGFGHLVHRPEFDALIAPIEEDDLINENLSFLKKDFTVTFAKVSYSSLDDEDVWNNETDNNSCRRSNISDVSTDDVLTLKDLDSPRRKASFNGASSQETVLGDLPVSEESGYSTIKSSSFFQKPNIKALLELPPPLPVELTLCHRSNTYDCNNDGVVAAVICRNVSTASSLCTIDICSIESKGLQTEANETCERSTQDFPIEEEEEEVNSVSSGLSVGKVRNLQAVQVIKIDIAPSTTENKQNKRRVKLDKGYKLWLRKFKYAFRERKQKFSSFTCITTPNNNE